MASEDPIPVTEYLIDALRHIEEVAGKVQRTIEGTRVKAPFPAGEPRTFGRGCDITADFLPRPFGRGCADTPTESVGPRKGVPARGTTRGRASRGRR